MLTHIDRDRRQSAALAFEIDHGRHLVARRSAAILPHEFSAGRQSVFYLRHFEWLVKNSVCARLKGRDPPRIHRGQDKNHGSLWRCKIGCHLGDLSRSGQIKIHDQRGTPSSQSHFHCLMVSPASHLVDSKFSQRGFQSLKGWRVMTQHSSRPVHILHGTSAPFPRKVTPVIQARLPSVSVWRTLPSTTLRLRSAEPAGSVRRFFPQVGTHFLNGL